MYKVCLTGDHLQVDYSFFTAIAHTQICRWAMSGETFQGTVVTFYRTLATDTDF